MIVLGLDPGSNITGFALLEDPRGGIGTTPQRMRLISAGFFRLKGKTVEARLCELWGDINGLLDEQAKMGKFIVAAGVEHPFVQHRNAIVALSEARGCLITAVALRKIPIHDLAPATVKKAAGVGGNAKKAQVAAAMTRMFNLAETPMADAADAIAVAVATANRVP